MTVLNTADALRYGGFTVDKAYLGSDLVWAPTSGLSSATLTIPAQTSTLTNFVTRVDLADLPVGWWDATSADLGNVLVKQAGTVIPFDLVRYDRTAKTGELFFKATLGTSANVFTITTDGTAALAVTDPNGRNAVWSDYLAVIAGALVNRTGGSGLVATGTFAVRADGWLEGAGNAYVPDIPGPVTQWSMGVGAYSTDSSSSNKAAASFQLAGSTNNAYRETIVDQNGDTRAVWNSTDSWRTYGAVARNVAERRVLVHDGTTRIDVYLNGALGASDAGVAQRPGGTSHDFVIGAGHRSDAIERWQGRVNYAYVRAGLLSASWIAAEYASWQTPSAFYTVTYVPPGFSPASIPGLVAWYSAEAMTGLSDGAAMTSWTDLSGNGNHAAVAGGLPPLWRAAAGSGGGPAVQFRGTPGGDLTSRGYFTLPDVMAGATAGELFAQIKADVTVLGGGGYKIATPWSFGGTTDQGFYPYTSTSVYELFGLPAANRQSFVTTEAILTAWRRYNVWAAASDFQINIDDTGYNTYTGSATITWDPSPVIGHGAIVQATGANSYPFQGYMSTVLIYNRKLTPEERADIAAWMTANPSGGTI